MTVITREAWATPSVALAIVIGMCSPRGLQAQSAGPAAPLDWTSAPLTRVAAQWKNVSPTSVVFHFTSNGAARSYVEYGPAASYGHRTATTQRTGFGQVGHSEASAVGGERIAAGQIPPLGGGSRHHACDMPALRNPRPVVFAAHTPQRGEWHAIPVPPVRQDWFAARARTHAATVHRSRAFGLQPERVLRQPPSRCHLNPLVVYSPSVPPSAAAAGGIA